MADFTPITPSGPAPSSGEDERLAALRRLCLIDYLLHIGGLVLSAGLLSFIALVVNYLKRSDAQGTIYASHMTWMIRTFWWWLLWVVVTGLLALVSLGVLVFLMAIPYLWFLYRMIKGLLALNDRRALPAT